MIPRLTCRTINKAIAAAGIKLELVRNKTYHYFMGDDVPNNAYTTSVLVYRTNTFTVAEWVAMAQKLKTTGEL